MQSPNISRRTLAAGLALAPVAGLPALAGAATIDDPVFIALADHNRALAAYEAIQEAPSEPSPFVTYKGKKAYSLSHLNDLAGRPNYRMTAAELEETIAQLRRGWAMQQEEAALPIQSLKPPAPTLRLVCPPLTRPKRKSARMTTKRSQTRHSLYWATPSARSTRPSRQAERAQLPCCASPPTSSRRTGSMTRSWKTCFPTPSAAPLISSKGGRDHG